ncbi:hypothetical protein [Bacillus sonorensis]|uniref:hypothetical protein n=1 Tax=Bacillus sonorensis TaxID=119858 RepID=UPI00285356B5|nr:hypothetical protein [Bacillus sonorensis]MDR4959657.1 hypothetical protein [Bacillus sonorensis]
MRTTQNPVITRAQVVRLRKYYRSLEELRMKYAVIDNPSEEHIITMRQEAVIETLNCLGLQIEGVNDW